MPTADRMDYVQWLDYIFATPLDAKNTPAGAAVASSLAPTEAVGLITRIFSNSGRDLARFTHRQVADGLKFIGSAGESGWVEFLYDARVPRPDRLAGVRSIATLFRRCFVRRCADDPGASDPEVEPLNSTCFMWWDRFPGSVASTNEEDRTYVDRELIGVMAETLHLPHHACRYSALHGLGHWQPADPLRVRAIIDDWLGRNREVPEELLKYARAAREGNVM